MTKRTTKKRCPCGGADFEKCCGRFISNTAIPQTAVELMRSRYTAYSLGASSYLQSTWHKSTRPSDAIVDKNDMPKWIALDIRSHHQNGDRATVEFVARYKISGRAHRLHEVSNFVRELSPDGERWYYVDGSFPEDEKDDS